MSLDNRTSVIAMVAVAILMSAALFGAIAVATSSNHGSDTQHNNDIADRFSSFCADSDSSENVRVRTTAIAYSDYMAKDSRIAIYGDSDLVKKDVAVAAETMAEAEEEVAAAAEMEEMTEMTREIATTTEDVEETTESGFMTESAVIMTAEKMSVELTSDTVPQDLAKSFTFVKVAQEAE